MALWGANTSDESKPKWLTEEEKSRTYASEQGWVFSHLDGTREVLVSIGKLNTDLGAPTITSVFFANTPSTYIQGHTNAFVTVAYNEAVVVTGVPTLLVEGTTTNATASYVSGNNTNKILFKFTVPAAEQTLSIKGQTLAVNSTVTIVDSGNNLVNASPTFANTIVVGVQAKANANTTVSVPAA